MYYVYCNLIEIRWNMWQVTYHFFRRVIPTSKLLYLQTAKLYVNHKVKVLEFNICIHDLLKICSWLFSSIEAWPDFLTTTAIFLTAHVFRQPNLSFIRLKRTKIQIPCRSVAVKSEFGTSLLQRDGCCCMLSFWNLLLILYFGTTSGPSGKRRRTGHSWDDQGYSGYSTESNECECEDPDECECEYSCADDYEAPDPVTVTISQLNPGLLDFKFKARYVVHHQNIAYIITCNPSSQLPDWVLACTTLGWWRNMTCGPGRMVKGRVLSSVWTSWTAQEKSNALVIQDLD